MTNPQPGSFQLDESTPLKASHFYYIKRGSGLSNDGEVKDVTETLRDASTETFLDEAASAAATVDVKYVVKGKSWLSNAIDLSSQDGTPIASLGSGIKSLGHRKLSFTQGSEHSSHDIEFQTLGMGKKGNMFVQESVVYFWECPGGETMLTKVVGEGKKIKVGRYLAKRNWSRQGLFLVDEAGVDVVVALMTCLGTLSQSDSFTK